MVDSIKHKINNNETEDNYKMCFKTGYKYAYLLQTVKQTINSQAAQPGLILIITQHRARVLNGIPKSCLKEFSIKIF